MIVSFVDGVMHQVRHEERVVIVFQVPFDAELFRVFAKVRSAFRARQQTRKDPDEIQKIVLFLGGVGGAENVKRGPDRLAPEIFALFRDDLRLHTRGLEIEPFGKLQTRCKFFYLVGGKRKTNQSQT